MKINYPDFSKLLNVVEQFGFLSAEVQEKTLKEIEELKTVGFAIENIDQLTLGRNELLYQELPDGTKKRVNLYIAVKETDLPFEEIKELSNVNYNLLYKYHITKCSTLTQMFANNRKHRYKTNSRTDGRFFFQFSDQRGQIIAKNSNQRLNVCKNCLKKIGYKGSDKDVKEFNLETINKQYEMWTDQNTKELQKGENAEPNVYKKDWTTVSNRVKEESNYRCNEYGWSVKNESQKRYIHTHHINGDKTDNRPQNLKVLCIKCHSKQPKHGHMKGLPDLIAFQNLMY